jgi:catechol 2,3-dioxygenase-like lactoylglutathione lyase family enzyme
MAACFRYIVNDVSAALEFYTSHLGFRIEMHPSPEFAEISRGDMHLYLSQPSGRGGGGAMHEGAQQRPGGWNRIHLTVEDLDRTVATLKSAGCRFRGEVIQGVAGKQILLQDPSGNLVELFQPNTSAYRAPGTAGRLETNRTRAAAPRGWFRTSEMRNPHHSVRFVAFLAT